MRFIGAFSFSSISRRFSSLRAVLLCSRRLRDVFYLFFSVRFFEGLVHMPRNTMNSIAPLLDPHGPTLYTSGESAPSTTSNSTSSSSFTSSPSSVSISAKALSQAISQAFQQSHPHILAAFREKGAPNSSSSTCKSVNPSAVSSSINVPSTYTSTSTGCRSSSPAGSVTVPSFLLLIRLLVFPWFLVLPSRPSRLLRHHPCSILLRYCRPATQPWRLRSGKRL